MGPDTLTAATGRPPLADHAGARRRHHPGSRCPALCTQPGPPDAPDSSTSTRPAEPASRARRRPWARWCAGRGATPGQRCTLAGHLRAHRAAPIRRSCRAAPEAPAGRRSPGAAPRRPVDPAPPGGPPGRIGHPGHGAPSRGPPVPPPGRWAVARDRPVASTSSANEQGVPLQRHQHGDRLVDHAHTAYTLIPLPETRFSYIEIQAGRPIQTVGRHAHQNECEAPPWPKPGP